MMEKNYTVQELGKILSDMYENADLNRQSTSIHLFGIMYAPYIINNGYTPKQIINHSTLNDSYYTEVNKGINIYKCISSGKYDIQLVLGQTENKEIKQNTVATTYQTVELFDFITNPFSHRYLTSLLAKPFVILAGNSGTGKTRIAQDVAKWLERKDGTGQTNHLLVPVGADWTDNTKILGYYNPLANDGEGEYVKTQILEFLERAGQNPQLPFFLILDEMNLSRVERYFSDFLSKMETVRYGAAAEDVYFTLDGYPGGKLLFPKNLFITGTVNVDETTYMFSPKVLDRANVIEFKPNAKDVLDNFVQEAVEEESGIAPDGMAESFLKLALEIRTSTRLQGGDGMMDTVVPILEAVQNVVQDTDFAFAFRTTKEIRHYVNAAYKINPEANITSIMDEQVLQKILPKIHGNRSQLKDLLEKLSQVCQTFSLKESEAKIDFMQKRLRNSQFASFM